MDEVFSESLGRPRLLGRRMTPWTTEKMAVLAPIPSASVSIVTTAIPSRGQEYGRPNGHHGGSGRGA